MLHFCCRSQEWSLIPEDDRKKLGLTFSNDGEFWSVPTTVIDVKRFFVVFIFGTLFMF